MANRVSDKITKLTDKIYVCRSGSAADTQAMADYATMYLNMHRSVVYLSNEVEPNNANGSVDLGEPVTVKTASALLHQLTYSNRYIVDLRTLLILRLLTMSIEIIY